LDRDRHKSQLQAAQNLTQQLGDTAKGQHADAPTPDPKLDLDHLAKKEAHLLMHGHAGTAITTPQSAVIATGKNLDQVSQRDTHQTAGRRWIHNVGESISLFAANTETKIKETIKLIAAKGNVLIQAQSNDVELTADKKITITACKENLTATAGKEFLLQSGGGYIRISGGNVERHCPKELSMKAKDFVHTGSATGIVQAPQMPTGTISPIEPSLLDVPIVGDVIDGVLNVLALPASVGREDGLTVQPFTGKILSKPEIQDAKFGVLTGGAGSISALSRTGTAA